MKSIRVELHGSFNVLELVEVSPIGKPNPNEVIVAVRAAGVNFMDIAQRRGDYPRDVPFIPGVEGAGVISAMGSDVRGVKMGDRVSFSGHPGAYAEEIAIDADWLIPLPDELTFEQGAAFPLQGTTAHFLIHEFRKPARGDYVLIHAASGGLGLLLVQWAKHLGANIIGTVSSAEKIAAALAAGANHVINYSERDFAAEVLRITNDHGADVIFDSVGKATLKQDLEAIAWRGHIVCCGASSGPPEPLQPYALAGRSASLSFAGRWARTPQDLISRAAEVLTGIQEGWLRLKIDTVLPLESAAQAHNLMESRKSQGKIVLTM